jgi:outer membrane protein W
MKKIAIALVVVMIASSALFAQDIQPAAKAGAKSLNFTFAGLGVFGLGSPNVTGGLGASYFLSNDAALRVGLQIQSTSTTTPWNDVTNSNPGADGKSSTFGFGVTADYLMYMSGMTSRVKPFAGVGVGFMMNSSDVKHAVANNAGNGTLLEVKNGTANDGTTFYIAAAMGAEFFLYPELSLSAEYDLNLIGITSLSDATTSVKGSPDITTKRGSTTTILGFGAAGATLHIYF